MDHRISATELARQLGDVLGRIRYRGDRFVIEKHGVPLARLVPVGTSGTATLGDALAAWRSVGESDLDLADALERIGAADRPPSNPWAS